jgi:hypothetical protein
MSLAIFEIDYSLKDAEVFKAAPKDFPQYVVAENVFEAVKRAKEFEDDNLTLLKCNLVVNPSKVAVQKKAKGLQPTKETE